MKITRTAVTSSQLKSAGYDEATKTLQIEFVSAKPSIYEYENVPVEVFNALMAAASIGSYFIRNIKFKFVYHKLTAEALAEAI